MPILNYTTQISVDKTISEIQVALAKAGARAILVDYGDNGEIKSLAFKMVVNENEIAFKLPAEPDKIFTLLKTQRGVPKKLQTMEQARRVAWRIIKDWVEAQLAIIETKMVKPDQVFLPYAITRDGKTLYESVIDGKVLLGDGNNG